jgi:hypothetical protein
MGWGCNMDTDLNPPGTTAFAVALVIAALACALAVGFQVVQAKETAQKLNLCRSMVHEAPIK